MVNKAKMKKIMKQIAPKVTPIGAINKEPLILPNHSGDNIKGFVSKPPVKDVDFANKKYVDDEISSIEIEGTDILSTGEGGGTKYLREDGDGTCSWQSVVAGNVEDGTASGQMVFWDGSSEYKHTETSELFWDDTNKRLGVGLNNPAVDFEVDGIIRADNLYTNATDHNVYVGEDTGGSLTYNTFIGQYAGGNNSGLACAGIGYNALKDNTAHFCFATGYQAGTGNTGGYLTAFGDYAGNLNTGDHLTAIGYYAGASKLGVKQSGDNILAFGYHAGQGNTGTNCMFFGRDAGLQNTTANQLIIKQAAVNATPLIQGDFSTGLVKTSSQQIGDGTNYLNVASDGEVNLHGTARVKKKIYIGANGIKAPGAKPATFVEDGLTGCWEFADAIEANQESVSGTFLIPSDMDRTVQTTLNIGWHADGVSPGDCKWQFEYLWISLNEDVTASAQETLTVVSTASSTSNGLIIAEITGIDLPSSTDNALFWKITRLSADADDTISDVTHLRGQFFEYTANKLGEAT